MTELLLLVVENKSRAESIKGNREISQQGFPVPQRMGGTIPRVHRLCSELWSFRNVPEQGESVGGKLERRMCIPRDNCFVSFLRLGIEGQFGGGSARGMYPPA